MNSHQQRNAESLMAATLLRIRSASFSQKHEEKSLQLMTANLNQHSVSNYTVSSPNVSSQVPTRSSAFLSAAIGQQQHCQSPPLLPLGMMAALQAANNHAAANFNTDAGSRSVSLMNLLSRSPSASLNSIALSAANSGLHSSESAPYFKEQNKAASLPSKETMKAVRREQVEAALHSKPQRGRKRDNLSDLERLELTRTRNREHAKSTRLRKKARYQDLLDCEEKLREVEECELLNNIRRNCILDFLQIRQNMMRVGCHSDQLSVEDDKTTLSGNTRLMPRPSKLADVVESTASFLFEDYSNKPSETFGLEKLRQLDEKLVFNAVRIHSSSIVQSLKLIVHGGSKSIALSPNDTAFAVVELVVATSPNSPIVKGIHCFEFMPGSEKLRFASWTPIDGTFGTSGEHIDGQDLHPSVVSLDPVYGDDAGDKSDSQLQTMTSLGKCREADSFDRVMDI